MKTVHTLTLLAALAWGQTASAATYYVNPVGGSDANNGTTTALAVKTIDRAGDLAVAGDTVKLMTGHYQVYNAGTGKLTGNILFGGTKTGQPGVPRWRGASGNYIIIEPYSLAAADTPIFDTGHPDFKTGSPGTPNTAWVHANTGGAGLPADSTAPSDEYISVRAFAKLTSWGHFLTGTEMRAGDKLMNYGQLMELRGGYTPGTQTVINESEAQIPLADPRTGPGTVPGSPTLKMPWAYRGPGLWWNNNAASPYYQHVHIRLGHTHFNMPGLVIDYTGLTDPRQMPLGIYSQDPDPKPGSGSLRPMDVSGSYLTFKNLIVQGGEDTMALSIGGSGFVDYVTFDHCTFNVGRFGPNMVRSNSVKFLHCIFDGQLPSYVGRADVKKGYSYIEWGTGLTKEGGRCSMSADNLLKMQGVLADGVTASNADTEVANCEFRDGHDGMYMAGVRSRIHHNLFENLNDDAWYMKPTTMTISDMRIYNNVVRQSLQYMSYNENGLVTGPRYIYRNIFDNRVPTMGTRSFPQNGYNDPVDLWRDGSDFKVQPPFGENYVYHNTFVQGRNVTETHSVCSAVFDGPDTGTTQKRYFFNNIHMNIGADLPIYVLRNPACPMLSNGNVWHRRVANPTANMYDVDSAYISNPSSFVDRPAMTAYAVAQNPDLSWALFDINSIFTNPQFINAGDYYETSRVLGYINTDYRLRTTAPISPAIGAGVDLTAVNWGGVVPPDSVASDTTPDIGALPSSAVAVAVGVDNRYVFPDGQTPIAEAGDYSVVADASDDGFETISFNSTGTSDPNGQPLTYSWTLNGSPLSTASSFSVGLPVGTHKVYLTASDNSVPAKTGKDMREVVITGKSNLTRNPDFESSVLSTDWTLGTSCSLSTVAYHLGGKSLRMVGTASGQIQSTQSVPIVTGSTVRISCWIKTVTMPASKYARLTIDWLNSAGGTISSAAIGATVGTTTDWIPGFRTASLTAPAGAVACRLKPNIDNGSTGGTAYFDDFVVAVTDNKVPNGHLEQGFTGWTPSGNPLPVVTGVLANVRTGIWSVEFPPQISPTSGTRYVLSPKFTVVPTTTYTFKMWYRASNLAYPMSVKVRWLNSSGGELGNDPVTMTPTIVTNTTGYVEVTGTRQAVTNAAFAQVRIYNGGAATETGTLWIDDVYVK